jgi:hypothetical protein
MSKGNIRIIQSNIPFLMIPSSSVLSQYLSLLIWTRKKAIAAGSWAERARKSDIVMASELPFQVRFQAEQPIADDIY